MVLVILLLRLPKLFIWTSVNISPSYNTEKVRILCAERELQIDMIHWPLSSLLTSLNRFCNICLSHPIVFSSWGRLKKKKNQTLPKSYYLDTFLICTVFVSIHLLFFEFFIISTPCRVLWTVQGAYLKLPEHAGEMDERGKKSDWTSFGILTPHPLPDLK